MELREEKFEKNEVKPNPSSRSVSPVTCAVTCKTGDKHKLTLYKGEWIWFQDWVYVWEKKN